jgi:ligand-binding sensor domain-containing protein/signal transduction histidine kinase/AraC-like DNA-binding protein/ActR/RegA family two-component response regulator
MTEHYSPAVLRFLIWLSVAIPVVRSQAQNIAFNHFNVESGLSQNSVLTIVQDRNGFMWFGTRHGLNRFDGRNFRIFLNDNADSTSISNNYVHSSLCDSRGDLWVGTSYGLNRYDGKSGRFRRTIANPANGLRSSVIYCLYEDKQRRFWVGTGNGLHLRTGPNRYVPFLAAGPGKAGNEVRAVREDRRGYLWAATSSGLFRLRKVPGGYRYKKYPLKDTFVTCLLEDQQGTLWAGTKYGGVSRYDAASDSFRPFPEPLLSPNVRSLMADRSGKIWMATLEGISIFDPSRNLLSHYRHEPENRKSLAQNSAYSLFQDTNGSIWIGTYYGGVDIVYSSTTPFLAYQNQKAATSLSQDVISSISGDPDGHLWIGTEGGGINFFDPQTGTFRNRQSQPGNPSGLASNLVKAVFRDGSGQWWVGMHLGGLQRKEGDRFVSYRHRPGDRSSLSSDNVIAVGEDGLGRLWAGTDRDGVNILEKNGFRHGGDSLRITSAGIRTFFRDSRRRFWIGTGNGLNRLSADGRQLTWFTPGGNNRLPSGEVNCIQEDARGTIWVGMTGGGFCRLNPDDSTFTAYNEKDGLAHNNVQGILYDDQGYLWISTDNGLSRFDPVRKTFKNYTTSDGLPGNEFSPSAAYRAPSGELYFGGYHGLVRFDPRQIVSNDYVPPLVFTGLRLFNKPVEIGDATGLLSEDLGRVKELTFSHGQSIFTIDFALLNYIKSGKNRYAYRLVGLETDWNQVRIPSATYMNLPPGDYTFEVRAGNNDGVWTTEPIRLPIRVLPPFWATWWAYGLYALTLAGIAFLIIRFFWLRESFRRNYELHQLKLNFFTNISHEIRTHLTLIIGPVEKLLLTAREEPALHRQLTYVQTNTDRLLKLVSELMDFRKVESRNLTLKVSENDLVAFIREIFSQFQEQAENRNIQTDFLAEVDQLPLYFDREQIEKIIYNLLTNAFKFTPDGGVISILIQANPTAAEIRFVNTGRGITQENLRKLFTNFFQVQDYGFQNTGYGIGLALSKSIAELHRGNLTAESDLPDGPRAGRTCFTLTLLQGMAHFDKAQFVQDPVYAPAALPSPAGPAPEPQADASGKPTLLLVEDNPEMQTFIQESLAGRYHLVIAGNGIEGWETAVSQIPDVIISDVMMPEMDGLTLCRQLKDDPRTSHIPVILLTAKAALPHQIDGLETGADAYLTKPFSVQVLELNVRNLLRLRHRMQEKFAKQVLLEPKKAVVETPDGHFLEKMTDIIEAHLEDTAFGVAMLCVKMGMSAPVLYRKVKALTGLSVNDLIKSIRLKKAAQLLRQNQYAVFEVAYTVGFEDRKYFSKEFKKMYGQTPKEYAAGK